MQYFVFQHTYGFQECHLKMMAWRFDRRTEKYNDKRVVPFQTICLERSSWHQFFMDNIQHIWTISMVGNAMIVIHRTSFLRLVDQYRNKITIDAYRDCTIRSMPKMSRLLAVLRRQSKFERCDFESHNRTTYKMPVYVKVPRCSGGRWFSKRAVRRLLIAVHIIYIQKYKFSTLFPI